MNALAPYLEGFKSLPTPAQPWLRTLRESALQRAAARGFPGARDEAWKYTSLAALEKRAFKPSASASKLEAHALDALLIPGFAASRAVFVNGRFRADLSDLPQGLRAKPLSEVEGPPSLAALPEEWKDDTFVNLNTALFQDGLWLEIEPGQAIDTPLELLHVSIPEPSVSSHHLRHVIGVGPGSRLTLVERYAGLEGAKHLTNAVMQVALAKDAQLTHVRVQEESGRGFHVGRVLVEQAAGSQFLSHNLQLGAAWSRLDIHTRLAAEGAGASLQGLYVVDGRQHIDNHTRIDHAAPHTTSRELYRGIMDGQGRAVFNGQVRVASHAVKTDASQANHNLILSRGAEIDTKPELEIYADDVKCSHGATIGQLDEDQLFYLRSRGLGPEVARQLLIGAFAEQILSALPHPALAARARLLLGATIHLPVQP